MSRVEWYVVFQRFRKKKKMHLQCAMCTGQSIKKTTKCVDWREAQDDYPCSVKSFLPLLETCLHAWKSSFGIIRRRCVFNRVKQLPFQFRRIWGTAKSHTATIRRIRLAVVTWKCFYPSQTGGWRVACGKARCREVSNRSAISPVFFVGRLSQVFHTSS